MAEVLLLLSGALLAKQLSSLGEKEASLPRNDADLRRFEYRFDETKDFEEQYPTHPQETRKTITRPVPNALPRGYNEDIQRNLFSSSFNEPKNLRMLPMWARQANPSGTRQEVMNEDPQGQEIDPTYAANDSMRYHSHKALDPRTRYNAQSPVEQEYIRPPLRGGDEGYDPERGRGPIPRYHKYDLGDDKATGLGDQGMTRGFAVGQAGRSRLNMGDSWDIMPNRTVDSVARNQHLPFQPASLSRNAPLGGAPVSASRDAMEWSNGSTGKVNSTKKGIVYPVRNDTDRRFADGSVDSYSAQTGSRARAEVPRHAFLPRKEDVIMDTEIPSVPTFAAQRGINGKQPVPARSLPSTTAIPVRPPLAPAPMTSRRSQNTHASASDAVKKTGWRFSFHLKDLLNTDEPASVAPRITHAERTRPVTIASHVLPSIARLDERMDVPSLPPIKQTAPDKKVLFSEEERSAYKHDSKKVDVNLSARAVHLGQTRRPGADGMSTDQAVDHRNSSQGRVIDLSLDTSAAKLSRTSINEFKSDSTMSRPAMEERVDFIPSTRTISTHLGKQRKDMFPSTVLSMETSPLDRVEKKQVTSEGHGRNLLTAAKYGGASRPTAATSVESFSQSSDDGILFGNDVILERSGSLTLAPTKMNPHLRDGPLPRLSLETTSRTEFRKRS